MPDDTQVVPVEPTEEMMRSPAIVGEIDALYAKATKMEWRALHTRVDGADGYQILHGDLHGKTEGENLANLRLVATLVNRWPEIRALLQSHPSRDSSLGTDAVTSREAEGKS